MKKKKVEALCAEWFSECLDPNDQEGLAAFQNWMEQLGGRETRSVTLREIVTAWDTIRERQKLH